MRVDPAPVAIGRERRNLEGVTELLQIDVRHRRVCLVAQVLAVERETSGAAWRDAHTGDRGRPETPFALHRRRAGAGDVILDIDIGRGGRDLQVTREAPEIDPPRLAA